MSALAWWLIPLVATVLAVLFVMLRSRPEKPTTAEDAMERLRRMQEAMAECLEALRLDPKSKEAPLLLTSLSKAQRRKNVAAALADAPFRAYALATLFGIMPATFIFSSVGSGISEVLARGGTPDLNILREPYVLGPLVALGLLSLTTTVVQRLRKGRGK